MYRFRKISHLLDGHHELENQEIYFAPPEDLNDPMEGYKDIYWKGDTIVWRNFIVNYIRSVEYTIMVIVLYGYEKKLTQQDILVSPNHETYSKLPRNIFFQSILDRVFSNEFIEALPESLANRKNPVRRSELISYLEFFHPFIIHAISEEYQKRKLISSPFLVSDVSDLKKVIAKNGNLVNLTNRLEDENLKVDRPSEKMFHIASMTHQQVKLMKLYELSNDPKTPNTIFMLSEYPERYVNELETIMYPTWYSASFLSENTNSAVWGHYGDNHTGVCLKFKSVVEDNKPCLHMEAEPGHGHGRILGMRPHIFEKIEYHNEHPEIDFFRSLGRLNKLQLNALWYEDGNGNRSECGTHLNENEQEWRNNYWESFTTSITVKLAEWSYEKEFRLILTGGFLDYSTPAKRKLKYDFKDLESITFGIKTSDEDKVKIMQIIDEKCKKNKRSDFTFYQAYYSKETGKIESYKLSLLKFQH